MNLIASADAPTRPRAPRQQPRTGGAIVALRGAVSLLAMLLAATSWADEGDDGAGILRWDLDVAAGSHGAKAQDVRYKWEMAYAKDTHIGKEASERVDLMRRDYEAATH